MGIQHESRLWHSINCGQTVCWGLRLNQAAATSSCSYQQQRVIKLLLLGDSTSAVKILLEYIFSGQKGLKNKSPELIMAGPPCFCCNDQKEL